MKTTINANGKLLDLSQPIIMGIINVNADSFYQGSRVSTVKDAVSKAFTMIEQGAAIIDIGAMSSKPGSAIIDKDTEIDILLPIVNEIKTILPSTTLSIDTVHSSTAQACFDQGADMINDISAGDLDANMIPTVGQLKIPYIAMHMQGQPMFMQENPEYDDVISAVVRYFVAKLGQCTDAGIKDVIIDPGIGFGKTIEHNFALINNLDVFNVFKTPLLMGISRKSFIYKTLLTDADQALNGTTALHMACLIKGANILRVHDVREAQECITLFNKLVENPS